MDEFACVRCQYVCYEGSDSIVYCGDNCKRRWCTVDCAVKDGFEFENDASCSYCRNEEAEDKDLFNFLLKKHELKREDVLKEYLATIKENNHADNT